MAQAKELVKSGKTALLEPDLENPPSSALELDTETDTLESELDTGDTDAFDEDDDDEEAAEEDGEAAAAGAKGRSKRKAASKKKPYTDDSIRVYLQEIGRIRLLRADEEIELARKIADLLELERAREAVFQRMASGQTQKKCRTPSGQRRSRCPCRSFGGGCIGGGGPKKRWCNPTCVWWCPSPKST